MEATQQLQKIVRSWTIDQYKGRIIFIDTNGFRELGQLFLTQVTLLFLINH